MKEITITLKDDNRALTISGLSTTGDIVSLNSEAKSVTLNADMLTEQAKDILKAFEEFIELSDSPVATPSKEAAPAAPVKVEEPVKEDAEDVKPDVKEVVEPAPAKEAVEPAPVKEVDKPNKKDAKPAK
jgi:hypothetical protein